MKKPFRMSNMMRAYKFGLGDEYKKENEKLMELIHEAEGRSYERTITAPDIIKMLNRIESHILEFSTKKDAYGTTVSVDIHAQNFARAYRFTPMSTHFDAVWESNGWKITNIYRSQTRRAGHAVHICFTEETKKNMAVHLAEF